MRPLPLPELVKGIQNNCLPKRGVVITFDDGYADNLIEAKPILERLNVPATVFVANANLGSKAEFWWDDLERIFLLPGDLPEELYLSIKGQGYRWNLAESSRYTEEEYRRYRQWSVLESSRPTTRHSVYIELCGLLRDLPVKDREMVVSVIVKWAGKSVDGRHSQKVLSAEELRKLDEGGLIEIGAHTVNHPVLAKISLEEQIHEIRQNKSVLEGILGHSVTSFSYPFGGKSDYSIETVSAVKDAGFENACSNFPGKIKRDTDTYQVPRFLVRNWTGNEFKQHLKAFGLYE